MKNFSGFNLIELMMVVAIVGVLASIAIPSYNHYSHKAKFTEVIQAIAPFKLAVETCAYQQNELSNCKSGESGIPSAFNASDPKKGYVQSVMLRNSGGDAIQIIATSQNIGKQAYTYILNAVWHADGQLQWTKDSQSTCQTAALC